MIPSFRLHNWLVAERRVSSTNILSSPQALPPPNAETNHDTQALASYSYHRSSRTLISYDTPTIATQKVAYIKHCGLGGAMWWESSGDLPVSHPGSLIRLTVEGLGGFEGGGLEKRENCLRYPDSSWENLKGGMAGE